MSSIQLSFHGQCSMHRGDFFWSLFDNRATPPLVGSVSAWCQHTTRCQPSPPCSVKDKAKPLTFNWARSLVPVVHYELQPLGIPRDVVIVGDVPEYLILKTYDVVGEVGCDKINFIGGGPTLDGSSDHSRRNRVHSWNSNELFLFGPVSILIILHSHTTLPRSHYH